MALLRAHRKRQSEERLALGEHWVETGLVFTRPGGAGLNPGTVSRTFHTAVSRAPRMRPVQYHDLRHLTATTMLRSNVPVPVVAKILGHGSAVITAQIYSHVLAEDAREEMTAAFAPSSRAG